MPKDCQIYYKTNCTCKDSVCYDAKEGCVFEEEKEECIECSNTDILKCYEC